MPHVELPQTEFKAVVLGETKVGKTSLVLRFTEGHYRENSRSPTIGAFFLTKRVQTSSGITAKVQIWDTAGQAQFRKMAPIYWRNGAAILLCYDVGNLHSWKVALEWLKELRNDKVVLEKNIVLTLVATKSDLFEQQQYHRHNQSGKNADKDHNMVPMDQVEQVLESLNQNVSVTTTPMKQTAHHNASSSAAIHSTPTTATTTAATTATTNTTQNYQGNGQGQILHVHTSARHDGNVDLLFQKVAEEVLYVREQERNLWMNYGIKYKHYGTAFIPATLGNISTMRMTPMTTTTATSPNRADDDRNATNDISGNSNNHVNNSLLRDDSSDDNKGDGNFNSSPSIKSYSKNSHRSNNRQFENYDNTRSTTTASKSRSEEYNNNGNHSSSPINRRDLYGASNDSYQYQSDNDLLDYSKSTNEDNNVKKIGSEDSAANVNAICYGCGLF
jgi:small GTP-binding protein